ncbi:MAG: O-antigen ligase family protein [Chitinophagaceae bacterium]|nr:O-antigen ligase family protein [Chitinophagaceae bacterium]
MEIVKILYLRAYLLVMTLYVFLNKGVAYTYLVEALWLFGILLLLMDRKKVEFIWNKTTKLILFFIAISFIYILRGFTKYDIIDLIRDSFIFQYGWFVFILFLFKDKLEQIWETLFFIYKWFPFVALLNFILQYFVPFFETVTPFGGIPILLYKNGDMGVQLLISTLLLLYTFEKKPLKWRVLLSLVIVLDFLILASYSRSGIVAFLTSMLCFIYFNKDIQLQSRLRLLLKYLPVILLIVTPIYINIKVAENFQGRAVGLEQIKNNFSSIVGGTTDATSESNVVWRLVWWAKIIDYSFSSPNCFIGKGLGMNLATDDDIITLDDTLRSPHNFHLNIMARFGVLLFLIWTYFLIQILKPIFKKQLVGKHLLIGCILFAFLINASFDVFLEGPMGAFPFWTWVSLYLLTEDQAPLVEPIAKSNLEN